MEKVSLLTKENYKLFWVLLGKKGLGWLVAGILSGFFLVAVEYAIAIFLQIFLTSIELIPVESLDPKLRSFTKLDLSLILFGFIVIGIFRSFSQYLSMHSSVAFNEIINLKLRIISAHQVLFSKYFSQFSPSVIQGYIAEIFPKAGLTLYYTSLCIIYFVQIILLFLVMAWVAPYETLVGALGIVGVGVTVRWMNARVLASASSLPEDQQQLSASVQSITTNWLLIKIFNSFSFEFDKFRFFATRYANAKSRSAAFAALGSVIPPFAGIVLISLIIYFSQTYLETQGPLLLAFLYLFIRYVQILGLFVNTLGNAMGNRPHLLSALAYLKTLDQPQIAIAVEKAEQNLTLLKKDIGIVLNSDFSEIENVDNSGINQISIVYSSVTYKWPNSSHFALDSFSATFPANKITVVWGPSGSGKSTVVMLGLGLLKPYSGSANINHMDSMYFLSQYYFLIGYAGPDPFLSEGTIRSNLIYGLNRKATDEEIWAALEQAGFADQVRSLTGKLNYRVQESGSGLSTGQKQRLSLARSFLRKPKLLILDEATANLDKSSEKVVLDSVQTLKACATIVMISHHHTVKSFADNLIEL
jgi:ABC-type multidrug transport system fused ATPase/permease subunit